MDFFLIHHLKNGLPFNCALSKTCFAQPLKTDWEGGGGGGGGVTLYAGLVYIQVNTVLSLLGSNQMEEKQCVTSILV